MSDSRSSAAIIGNPVSSISSGKFLTKFLSMVSPIYMSIYVINDGVCPQTGNIRSIESTKLAAIIKRNHESGIAALFAYLVAQLGLFMGLLKCIRNVDRVIVFPIVYFLPVVLAKLAGKELLLYEAQDILSSRNGIARNTMLHRMKFAFLLVGRNLVIRLVDTIVVEGDDVVRQNQIEAFASKIRVIPQYVDTGRYQSVIDVEQRTNRIGFVASLDHRKGAMEFATAMKNLLEDCDNVQVVIVGRGVLAPKIAEILKDSVEIGDVQLVEEIPEDDLPGLMNTLKLLVVPSLSEGLPNIVLEAMACGTPVLATPVGAIPNVVLHGITGFLLEDNSSDCIEMSVKEVIFSCNLHCIAVSARRLMETEYSYEMALSRWRNTVD